MSQVTAEHKVPRSLWVAVGLCATVILAIVVDPRDAYVDLHLLLDTLATVLSGLLALLLWNIGARPGKSLARLLAIVFLISFGLDTIHALVSVEWSGPFAVINQHARRLHPATWGPAAYFLPIGVAFSLCEMRRKLWIGFGPGLAVFALALLGLFYNLPAYTTLGPFRVTRPALALVPLLWLAVAIACSRMRAWDRKVPTIGLMSLVMCLSSLFILFSRNPDDTMAMSSHLGKVCGYLIVLLSLLQMAALDIVRREEAEHELAQLNEELEKRVIDRSAKLDVANQTLTAEIAERLEAEISRRESDLRFQEIANSVPVHLWIADENKKRIWFNQQWLDFAGRTLEEELAAPSSDIHPEDIGATLQLYDEAFDKRTPFESEFRLRYKDGSWRWVHTRGVPRFGTAGEFAGYIGYRTDITDKKQAEFKLEVQLGRLQLIHQITRAIGDRQDLPSIFQVVIGQVEEQLSVDFCCIGLFDPANNSLTLSSIGPKSQAIAKLGGLEAGKVIEIDGNGLAQCVRGRLIYEPDIEDVDFSLPRRLLASEIRSLVYAPLLVESKVFGVLIAGRKAPKSFSSPDCEFLRQLSEHVALASHQAQLYTALQQAYDDLRRSQEVVMQQERLRALGQMASGIAHDINNAISPIAIYTETILETETGLSDRARGYLEVMQRAIEDVAATVARMREFYRQREPQLGFGRVDINELIGQVLSLTRARWSDMALQRGAFIELVEELSPDAPLVLGDETEIREALTNLIFNAVDSMPEGGTLLLRTQFNRRSSGEKVIIEVTDTGIGMDEQTRLRCVEPFFTTKGERGTGLGLAMVYGMAQRHSIDLEIDSMVGKGTTIRLLFEGQSDEALSTDVVPATVFPRGLRILVVDDDPLLLKSLRDALELDDHLVTSAANGKEGIVTFKENLGTAKAFDVVITDLGMPYVDGRQVASAVKEDSPETPVILLTGWGQRMIAEGDIPANVDHVLSKPPKLKELRGALLTCCQALPSPECETI